MDNRNRRDRMQAMAVAVVAAVESVPTRVSRYVQIQEAFIITA